MKFSLLYLLFLVVYVVKAQDDGEQAEDSSGSGEGSGSGESSGSGDEETVTTTTLKSVSTSTQTTRTTATTATEKSTTTTKSTTMSSESQVSQESSTKSPSWSVELPQSNTETPQQVLEWVNNFLMTWLNKTQTPKPGPGLTSSTSFGVQQNPLLKPPRVPGYNPESDARGPGLRPTTNPGLNIPRVPRFPRRQLRPRSGGFYNYRTYRGFQL